jgi:glycosyltransferase involved in cell wall biosynthesis
MNVGFIIDVVCWLCLLLCFISTVMVTLNTVLAAKMRRSVASVMEKPLVSLLVPVRDEAHNLIHLLPALLDSTYRPLEVIILDDGSRDDSVQIATSLTANAPFPVRLMQGVPWSEASQLSGKAHACAQLAELAKGEILIFCDADVRPSRRAIQHTVNMMMQPGRGEQISGVSALPAQSCGGLLERLLIPWIMHLPLMMSLPLFCSWRLPFNSMQIANGQWVALFKNGYFDSGGHRNLGTTPLEDVALARQIHRVTGRGVQPVFAASDISVAMYSDWRATLAGFSKNLVAIGGGHLLAFGCIITLTNIVFMFPLWGYFIRPELAIVSLVLIALSRLLTAKMFKMPLYDVLLHPFSLLLLDIAAYKSLRSSLRGSYEWKGRVVKWSSI